MGLRDRLRQVYVDDMPVLVPEETTAGQIIEATGYPSSKQLCRNVGGGTTQVLDRNRKIEPENGERFESSLPVSLG